MLEISNLHVGFRRPGAPRRELPAIAVHDVSVVVSPGEIVGLVGESGSGKSVTCHAALGLLPKTATVAGDVRIDGRSLLGAPRRAWSSMRGTTASIVLQDPFGALNPLLTVGAQITDAVRANRHVRTREAREISRELLRDVGLPDVEQLMRRYPHELSGGMSQRVVIAIALSGNPRYLLADEPTTALDVTVQAQVIELIARVAAERDMGVLFVTHDLGVAAALCDRVVVMQGGRVVEENDVYRLFSNPTQHYTRNLLNSLPARSDRTEFLAAARRDHTPAHSKETT
jgi:ABC-type dipeptide/oligopeptide/nickel transport system ATPase component